MISRRGAGLFAMGQEVLVDRHLRGKSVGRVDLRVDHGYFGNHMTIIQESPRANNSVGRSRIGCGRHGGRPSQEQEANPTLQT